PGQRQQAVSPLRLHALLAIQEHDLALDRLLHRREALPARAALTKVLADSAQLGIQSAARRQTRDDLAREEGRLDDEAQALQQQAAAVEKKMYSGEVSSPRELQAMQADVDQLRRHQRMLEGRELELMEQRDPLDRELSDLEHRAAALDDKIDRVRRE